ncbi:hypothetical protein [Afipia sp. GAS231]|uniref:hypothetical protein n=1 Tax=Afipia sp. GAS231 TaxID=1882747 RepID=UPI000B8724FB|nr:hypothetical protein [Afipia sp. GAS231]
MVETLKEAAARPTHRISCLWKRLAMADAAEQKYGAPQLTIHRADLLNALRRQLPESVTLLGHRVEAVDNTDTRPEVTAPVADL